jgi:hypothetical protein
VPRISQLKEAEELLNRLLDNLKIVQAHGRIVHLVESNTWRDSHGAIPSKLQSNLKALHLHACLRQLRINVVGLDESNGD